MRERASSSESANPFTSFVSRDPATDGVTPALMQQRILEAFSTQPQLRGLLGHPRLVIRRGRNAGLERDPGTADPAAQVDSLAFPDDHPVLTLDLSDLPALVSYPLKVRYEWVAGALNRRTGFALLHADGAVTVRCDWAS